MMKNKPFHTPLHSKDSFKRTFGCRHSQPNICDKNCMPNVCAFVRSDGICMSPPSSWPKQFKKLKEVKVKKK